MRFLSFFLLCFFAVFSAQAEKSAPAATKIVAPAEAKRLLGRHLFMDDYITSPNFSMRYDSFGDATVTNDNGLYRLHGKHEAYDDHFRFEN